MGRWGDEEDGGMRRWGGWGSRGGVWAIALVVMLVVVGCEISSEWLPKSSESSIEQTASPQPTVPQPTVPQPTVSVSPSPNLSLPTNLPRVDAERLVQHLQALTFERYQADDRDRARQYITNTLKTLGWQSYTQSFNGGVNLIAQRTGTDAAAGTILIAAHYDTVQGSPGADDNASAIAAALEVARLLGPRPTPQTLKVVFFDQEETGLLGSIAFTAKAQNLTNLNGVINLDMLGYACRRAGCQRYPDGLPISPPGDRGDFLAIVGDHEHEFLLQAFQLAARADLPAIITLPVPFKGLMTPDLLRSDHAPFWTQNIGAVIVTDTANFRNPNYHQPSDTAETIDFNFLTGVTQLIVNATTALLESKR